MRRGSVFWLVAALAVWGWMFASNVRAATAAFIVATIIGAVVIGGLLIFHITRAWLGR